MTHLADVLTEQRVGDHLTQEVEVRRHQRHDAAADGHRHVLLVVQSHFLQEAGRRLQIRPLHRCSAFLQHADCVRLSE